MPNLPVRIVGRTADLDIGIDLRRTVDAFEAWLTVATTGTPANGQTHHGERSGGRGDRSSPNHDANHTDSRQSIDCRAAIVSASAGDLSSR